MNTKVWVYLIGLYGVSAATADNTALVRRYLDGASGEMTARFQALLAAAA